MQIMSKTTQLSIRMTEDIRRDLEILADFYALSPSSLAHSYQERRKAPKFYLWGYKPQIALWQSN